MKLLKGLLKFSFVFFIVTFVIYWFHLDDKLIRSLSTKYMDDYFNNIERDVKL